MSIMNDIIITRVEAGLDPVYTFHMCGSTPDMKVGQILLLTLGQIQIKNGVQRSYVERQ